MDTQSSGTVQSPSTYSETSRTGSSRSNTSLNKDKDRDFTKDNAASPIDLECHIQEERITKILDEAIYKVKLSLCLPRLVHEQKILSFTLSANHFDDITFIFEQYDNPLFSTSLLNVGAMEDIKGGDISLKNRLNPELGHLIYILNSYPALCPVVEGYIEEMRAGYVSHETKPPHPGIEYMLVLEQFRDLMLKQMQTTAAEVLGGKIHLRKLEASNEKLKENIKETSDSLKEENDSFEETMALKADLICKLEAEVAALHNEATLKLKKKILDSDRQMVLATRAHLIKHELLKEEEIESRDSYDTVLRRHLLDEKNQRGRRFKVETQLLSWIQKYDLEMADKQVELDEFDDKYEDEKEQVEKLEIKLAEQDKEYLPLMAEREEEYHQEMSNKLQQFLIEHAARVIQYSWREVLANRAEKKRLKKLQKKMQAAAAAAEKKGGKK